eukprot:3617933-Prymnesium_polylepis.1
MSRTSKPRRSLPSPFLSKERSRPQSRLGEWRSPSRLWLRLRRSRLTSHRSPPAVRSSATLTGATASHR